MLMRRLGGAAAALVLGLSVSARAADDVAAPPGGGRWFDKFNLFGGKKADEPQVPPTVPVAGNTAAAAGVPAVAGPAAVGPVETEAEALLRRNKVCDALLQIAYDTNNPELQQRVEMLLQRVNDVYQLRTGFNRATFESDEATLSQRLGNGEGRRGPVPAERTRPERRTVNLPEDRE